MDSSVCTATRYWMERSGVRTPMLMRFNLPVQIDPGGPIQSPVLGYQVSLPGHGVNHPPHLAPRLTKQYNYVIVFDLTNFLR